MMKLLSASRPLLYGWSLSALGWGAVSLMLGWQLARDFSISPSDVLRIVGRNWVVWSFATPLIFRFVAFFPIEREKWLVSLPLQLLAGTAFLFVLAWIEHQLGPHPLPPDLPPGFIPPPHQPHFLLSPNLPAYLTVVSMAHAFYFYRRAQQRELRTRELAAGLTEARLQMLRSQIQPHFLFNSLNALAMLIRKDPDGAENMLGGLANFLRATLEESAENKVPLQRELEYAENYLAIEKIRFGRRLTYSFEIDSQAARALVPSFILQPLVENAVQHGIEPLSTPGDVSIQSVVEGSTLLVVVRDNGAGLRPPILEGIGLTNVRSRLREYYGEAYSLTLLSDSGTWVEMTIPLQFE